MYSSNEILRSSFLPLDCCNGTKLFLSFRNGWYRVETRFEIFKRTKDIHKAISLFEKIELEGL